MQHNRFLFSNRLSWCQISLKTNQTKNCHQISLSRYIFCVLIFHILLTFNYNISANFDNHLLPNCAICRLCLMFLWITPPGFLKCTERYLLLILLKKWWSKSLKKCVILVLFSEKSLLTDKRLIQNDFIIKDVQK